MGASGFAERVVKQSAKGGRCGLPVPLHRFRTSLTVAAVGSRAQADERRQTVAQRNTVGPQARGATIPVRERVNPHPFGVYPRAQIDNRRELVGARFSTNRQARVEIGDDPLKRGLETLQLRGHPRRIDRVRGTNPYLDVFEAWWASR